MKNLIKSFLIFLIIAFHTSCLKKQNLDDDNLGPAFDPIELTKALGQGFGNYDYNDIKPNEFTSYMLTQKIQDSYMQPIEQQDMIVDKSENTLDKLSLDVNVTKTTFSGGQSSQSVRKWSQDFPKQATKSTSTQRAITSLTDAKPPLFLFLDFKYFAFGACYDKGESPQTCHQLHISDIQFQVPPAAASQHQCADQNQCFISAKKIEFDMINKNQVDKDGKPQRIHFTFILSKEVPFLSRMLQYCSRSLYEINSSNQKILADLCYDINNYAFGTRQ